MSWARPPGVLRGLLVPADERRACLLVALTGTAAAIGDLLGGGEPDAVLTGTSPFGAWTFYRSRPDRPERHRPGPSGDDNPRAAALSARLGCEEREVLARMHGDILVLGRDGTGRWDEDVPDAVLELAGRARLWSPATGVSPGTPCGATPCARPRSGRPSRA